MLFPGASFRMLKNILVDKLSLNNDREVVQTGIYVDDLTKC